MAELKKKALSEPEEDEMKGGIEKYIEQDSSIPVDNQIEDSDEEIDIEAYIKYATIFFLQNLIISF